MPERNGLRLSAAAAMVLFALCARGMCDSPCCIDDLYCVVTDPSVCQTLGGVSASEIETCTDWAECGSNNEIFPTRQLVAGLAKTWIWSSPQDTWRIWPSVHHRRMVPEVAHRSWSG